MEREVEVEVVKTQSVTCCDDCGREVPPDAGRVEIDACADCRDRLLDVPDGPVLTHDEWTDPDHTDCDSWAMERNWRAVRTWGVITTTAAVASLLATTILPVAEVVAVGMFLVVIPAFLSLFFLQDLQKQLVEVTDGE